MKINGSGEVAMQPLVFSLSFYNFYVTLTFKAIFYYFSLSIPFVLCAENKMQLFF